MIEVGLGGDGVQALVDTGSEISLIRSRAAEAAGYDIQPIDMTMCGFAGERVCPSVDSRRRLRPAPLRTNARRREYRRRGATRARGAAASARRDSHRGLLGLRHLFDRGRPRERGDRVEQHESDRHGGGGGQQTDAERGRCHGGPSSEHRGDALG